MTVPAPDPQRRRIERFAPSISRRLRWTSRRRANGLIALSALSLGAIVATLAIILISGATTLESRTAQQRARLGVDLLVAVGSDMPDILPSTLRPGIGVAHDSELGRAVARGKREGFLSDLTLWDRKGRQLFSSLGTNDSERGDPFGVRRALRGADTTVAHPGSIDLSTGKRTGTLDAFEPLRDDRGRIFGVIEVSLPLRPIAAGASAMKSRILTVLAIGAVLVWLLLLPVMVRAAYAVHESWAPGRRRVLRDFRKALDRNEIELVYQPQIDPSHGGLHAVEALVRWRRDGKLRAPDTFIPFIEVTPLIGDLTGRVVELALGQLAAWRSTGDAPRMSVNLSARDLSDRGLSARISAAIVRHGVPANQLTFEVTETAILEDRACAQHVLESLSQLGVDIAVDDFGTGHASISRLHDFPIREVKIDRSFVGLANEQERSYLTAIVQFGQALGLRIVAEGVEDAETLVYLRKLGCDLVQGYHIAKPLPADAIPRWRTQGVLLGEPFAAAA